MLPNGFKMIEEEYLEDYEVTGYHFEHVKSGAKFVYIKSDDAESYCSINFKTLPRNNKGLTHILEHCILEGSRKYPIKGLFNELMKSSLNTSLGAWTYLDKTRYAFSSMNKKDFHNILDVCMDTIFYPIIYNNERIFKQEGWRYDLDNNGNIAYNGIVYNEMKDIAINPSYLVERKIRELCLGETNYKYISGGKPEDIVKATNNDILKLHKKYYHPSNMYIFLSGKESILDELIFFDNEYLKHYTKRIINDGINLQGDIIIRGTQEFYYPTNDDVKDKNYYSLSYLIKESTCKTNYDLNIINAFLYYYGGSPIMEELRKKDIYYNSRVEEVSYNQSINMFMLNNIDEAKGECFFDLIQDTLIDVSKNGIAKKVTEVFSARVKFNEKNNKNNMIGYHYFYNIIHSWLYGKSPFESIKLEEKMRKSIKNELNNGFIENGIKNYFLNNENNVKLVYKPRKTEINKLFGVKTKLSDERVKDIKKDIEEFRTYKQEIVEKPDICIPSVKISDVDLNPVDFELIEDEYKGVQLLFHPDNTGEIVYYNLNFDIMNLEQDKLIALHVFKEISYEMGTINYTQKELDNIGNIKSGISRRYIGNFNMDRICDYANYKFVYQSSGLEQNMDDMLSLFMEITQNIKLDDKDLIKHIVNTICVNTYRSINNNPAWIVQNRLLKGFTSTYKYWDKMTGIDYYNDILELNNNFSNKYDKLIEDIRYIQKIVFNKEKLIIGITCEEKIYSKIEKCIKKFIDQLPSRKYENVICKFNETSGNEAIILMSNNVAVVKGCNYMQLGYEYNAKMDILEDIINKEYLWKEVREKNGTYEVRIEITSDGNVTFLSDKGINLTETLKAFDGTTDFLKNIALTQKELDRYIIRQFKKSRYTPQGRGDKAIQRHMKKIKYEVLEKEAKEIANITIEDISKFADMIEVILENSKICVAGSEEIIMNNKELFDNIIRI
ncbi:MAG TPA: hypothetical protein DCP90_07315 [Clostridiales bacterium]|nr:MAG: hypothetical protein A2Y22_01710 [Clostridiales bacterium GWD2_32_59]HAN10406.1 hypothetical protein [Clostridiales bacterium]